MPVSEMREMGRDVPDIADLFAQVFYCWNVAADSKNADALALPSSQPDRRKQNAGRARRLIER